MHWLHGFLGCFFLQISLQANQSEKKINTWRMHRKIICLNTWWLYFNLFNVSGVKLIDVHLNMCMCYRDQLIHVVRCLGLLGIDTLMNEMTHEPQICFELLYANCNQHFILISLQEFLNFMIFYTLVLIWKCAIWIQYHVLIYIVIDLRAYFLLIFLFYNGI